MNSKARLLFAALFVGTFATAHAQLAWEKTEIELRPKIGDKQAVAQFRYENKGKTAINFKNVKSSCGCTVAKLEKNEVAPGEKGEITATFNIGGRTGLQHKAVMVETNDPEQPSLNLQLHVVIPAEVSMQPSFVYWKTGEEPKPKTITVKAGEGVAISKLDVSSSIPDFTTKVQKGSKDGEFLVSVQPKNTGQPLTATLTMKPDYPKTLYASARVTPPGSSLDATQ